MAARGQPCAFFAEAERPAWREIRFHSRRRWFFSAPLHFLSSVGSGWRGEGSLTEGCSVSLVSGDGGFRDLDSLDQEVGLWTELAAGPLDISETPAVFSLGDFGLGA